MAKAGTAALPSLVDAIVKLEQHLSNQPQDLDGWILLGRSYLTVDRYADAVGALKRAVDLSKRRLDVLGAYAEALIGADGGQVGVEAHAVLSEVLAGDRLSPQVRLFLGLGRAQRGDVRGALQDWIDLLALWPDETPWRPTVLQHIERAAAQIGVDPMALQPSAAAKALLATATNGADVPDARAGEAAERMPPAEREAMIRAMVDRLADRLKHSPEDPDGWQRLARAYDVLGEKEKADAARARAEQARNRK
jgi:cytochrome c-type biogenesis protein CcmH